MHFPSALKLVAAMLLCAIVAGAAYATPSVYLSSSRLTFANRPALPKTVMIKELRDSYGDDLWMDFTGYTFQYIEDSDAHAQRNPDPSKYALYKTENWMGVDGIVEKKVYGLTKENGEEINEWSLKEVCM